MDNLEERLIDDKLIAPWQLDRAKLETKNRGLSLWICLVELGFLSEDAIAAFLAQESGIPYVNVSDYAIDQPVLRLIEESYSVSKRIIPLFKLENTLFLACSNPLDSAMLDSVSKMTGLTVEPLVSGAHSILSALDIYWKLEEKNFELASFIIKQNAVQGFVPWRQAERFPLSIPLEVKILDGAVNLLPRKILTGKTFDIASNGTTLGAEIPLFLPNGITVLLSLRINPGLGQEERLIELRGKITRSAMSGVNRYLLGIKLLNIADKVKNDLLSLVSAEKP